MRSDEYTELKECTLKKAPDYLPEKLKDRINEIIESIRYVQTNPYVCYRSLKYPNFPPIVYEKDSDDWYRYLKDLNRLQRCFCLINNEKVAEIWKTFEKYAKSNFDYSSLYTWITNNFCRLINYEQDIHQWGMSSEIQSSIDAYVSMKRSPEDILKKAQELYNIFNSNISLIAPDGADCFEDLDKNNPEDQKFLDENGNPPYKINWDLLITDDEYFEFIDIFKKILEKLHNRVRFNDSERYKTTVFLHNPISRKKGIDGAQEIYFARELYIKFMQEFNKPLYGTISLILENLFGSPYTENEVIKICSSVRKRYKGLEKEIKCQGYELKLEDSFILSKIANNLKSEASKKKK